MSFRVWTIFYVFALLASAMATFGSSGIIATAVVFGMRAWLFRRSGPGVSLIQLLVAIFIFYAFVLFLLLPSVESARPRARLTQCSNNLKQLSLALVSEQSSLGHFPPAYTVDPKDNRLLSWRVAILPRMEHGDIYDSLDLSKTWDDPANSTAGTLLAIFQCPSHFSKGPTTNYLAVVGPRTAWPGARGRSIDEIKDGPENTILLIEASGSEISWAEPRDLTVDEAVDLLTKPSPEAGGHRIDNGFFYKPSVGRNMSFADGSVKFLATPINRKLAEALLTVDGGEQIDLSELENALAPQLDYAQCYAFGMFVILSLLPAAWMRRPWPGAISQHPELPLQMGDEISAT